MKKKQLDEFEKRLIERLLIEEAKRIRDTMSITLNARRFNNLSRKQDNLQIIQRKLMGYH